MNYQNTRFRHSIFDYTREEADEIENDLTSSSLLLLTYWEARVPENEQRMAIILAAAAYSDQDAYDRYKEELGLSGKKPAPSLTDSFGRIVTRFKQR